MLTNAFSMVSSVAVTSVLGFAYWWLAARLYPQSVVGLGAALISAMTWLSGMGMMGLGTLLMGRLGRQTEGRESLIATALLAAAVVSAAFGILFGWIAPLTSREFAVLGASLSVLLLFALGVVANAVSLVLDQAVIGLMRGGLQFWRNVIFAVVKLVALVVAGTLLAEHSGTLIYDTWTLGIVVSLLVITLYAFRKGIHPSTWRPRLDILRDLPKEALGHHGLNLSIQISYFGLPLVVTWTLGAVANSAFYTAWIIVALVVSVPATLALVLFASSGGTRESFADKIRTTLLVGMLACLAANIFVWLGADVIMNIFGKAYAEQAAWALRILSLGAFPLTVKDHWIAIRRKNNQLYSTIGIVVILGAAELITAAIGAGLGGLNGLAIAWLVGLCVQSVLLLPTVMRFANLRSITPVATTATTNETVSVP